MLPENLDRVLALPDEARVLDIGAWGTAVNRADWVIDVMPYETRGVAIPEGFGPGPERFTKETWLQLDMCTPPWPFEDGFFDFAICTFTLEDVRDPIGVCREMSRVAKAGYIEVPTVLDELSWSNPEPSGGPWLGHEHHRWIVSLEGDELVFLPKFHSLHANWRVTVPTRWARQLSVSERMLAHFWEGELSARERIAVDDYPFDELEQAIRDRFQPSAAELRAKELREKLRRVRDRTAHPARRAVGAVLGRMR